MFVRYYLELPLPPERVEEALLGSAPEWLSELAGEAQRRGDVLLAEVGVGPLGPRRAGGSPSGSASLWPSPR